MLGKVFIIRVMKQYFDDLKNELYKNVRKQIELQNNILDLPKGNLIIKRRYYEDYYYLSYRENKKVKTDYLGKLSEKEIAKIQEGTLKRKELKNELKKYKEEEANLRKIIKAINSKGLMKNVYNIMDLIVLLRPTFVWAKAKEAYLFGSYARGNMNEDSDINILVVGSDKDASEIEAKLEKATAKVVNVLVNEDNIVEDFDEDIEEEKLLIYGGIN